VSLVGDSPRVAFAGNGFVHVSIAPPVSGGTYTVGVEVEVSPQGPREVIEVSDMSGPFVKSTTCPIPPGVVRCTGTFTIPAKGLENGVLNVGISWRSAAPGPRIRKILVFPP